MVARCRRRHAAVALVLAACGSSGTHPHDAMVDAFPTAPHVAYPQVPDQGGPRLAHPQLVTITFGTEPREATFESFAQWIVGSQWLAAVGSEYGISAGQVAGVFHDPQTPPTTMTSGDVETYLATGIGNGTIPRPASLADALYIAYYPSTTTITATFVDGIMKTSCVDFGGYHGEVHQNGLDFAYAAIPTCAGAVPGLTADETTELVVSHEVIEAATDAFPITQPAYQLRVDPTDAWYRAFQFEVEVGDMCEEPNRFVRESGFVAQRTWSNAAAAAGGEPCVPFDTTQPVFGASATPSATQTVAAGGSVDYTLAGWSTAPVADWHLEAIPWLGPASLARGHVTFGALTLNNGATTTVHVTIPSTIPSGTVAAFLVESIEGTDSNTSAMWPISIVVQ